MNQNGRILTLSVFAYYNLYVLSMRLVKGKERQVTYIINVCSACHCVRQFKHIISFSSPNNPVK